MKTIRSHKQTTHNMCPTCKQYVSFDKFPKLYIKDFKKLKLKTPILYSGFSTFYEPDTKGNCNILPIDVFNFFRKNKKAETFESPKGYFWSLEMGRHDDKKGYRLVEDVTNKILGYITPYINKLEHLVGTEVKPNDLLPQDKTRKSCIPETSYHVDLNACPDCPKIEFTLSSGRRDKIDFAIMSYDGRFEKRV
ncbi:MAG: hypothetical protein PHC66_03430 [Candidatus Nanoarchaeia archaeon]|nr:hypothetical protein [Candidatus Nanoarchaeia archaeon]MDD5239788.1 hypothetical protein [Candidatus Nanoarchaeia archaeon]